jgi:hypothetical protein
VTVAAATVTYVRHTPIGREWVVKAGRSGMRAAQAIVSAGL